MNLPRLSLENRQVVRFFLAVLLFGGAAGFVSLGKKEDAAFVIKSAALSCRYPGASPEEVEMLVTEPIEREVQSMRSVHKITSESYYGVSRILVELDPGTPSRDIPQLWDELRRKALDVASRLPPGASAVEVGDDYGDVFGLYCALSVDEGFTWDELREWAQRIKTSLFSVRGVQKVTLYGEQTPVVNVSVSPAAIANFSIRPESIVETIRSQNTIVDSGEKSAGEMSIRILEDGVYKSLDDIRNQLLTSADGRQYRLGDIARVERGYAEPSATLMRVDGERAVGIGISTEPSADVVKVGRRIDDVLAAYSAAMPVGMTLTELYPEDRIAAEANRAFALNLAESVVIVVLMLMAAMGWRSGVLVGSSLLFTIGGTLLLMQPLGEGLNRTSLAGFIIAMGMLVDNAIVVTDNARRAMCAGAPSEEAFVRGAYAPRMALLGATLIAVFSFLPLYLAPSAVAEIVKPLFVVLALSLLLSWVLAQTQTPLFGVTIMRGACRAPKRMAWFEPVLGALLRYRWVTLAVVAAMFAVSLRAMRAMPQDFFPSLDKPYFRADMWLPEGYNIRDTERTLDSMGRWLAAQPEVVRVSATAGSTPPRYYLASGSVAQRPNYGNMLVEVASKRYTREVETRFAAYVDESYPDVWLRSSLFKLSPVPEAAIEIGFIGPDIDTLRRLTSAVGRIMRSMPDAANVRNSWGNRIPTWMPVYSQMRGQRIGVSRSELAAGLTIATAGYRLGEYREGDSFMPILMKDETEGGYNLTNLQALPVFSPSGRVYSLEQAVDSVWFEYRTGVVERYDRRRVMKAQCDPSRGANTGRVLHAVVDSVKASLNIPAGYEMKIFGEQESRDESDEALAANMPLTLLLIFTVLLLLFGNYRDPIAVLAMTPLVLVGVVAGLAVTGRAFDFFSMLGLLGLVGMNVKNGVVMVESIRAEKASGRRPYDALLHATHDRIVPVALASGTTVVGMTPLLSDSLFAGMAATIMGGLIVAALLTVLVLPVVYAVLYDIRKND